MKQLQHPIRRLSESIAELERQRLLRRPAPPLPPGHLSFCSNDYLGLADNLESAVTLGSGASRLVAGERPAHQLLEDTIRDWLGYDGVLSFTSGYAANVGALQALVQPGDFVISDALNHASIIDGLRLTRATVEVVPHGDLSAIEAALAGPRGPTWVVTESYFSMDADGPNLARLRELCDRAEAALFVDEAHALGVFGPAGAGRCAEAGVRPDVLVGTFGKAFGAGGAFVAGTAELGLWLWNRARSFVFSTGLSPALAEGAARRIDHARRNPELRNKTESLAEYFRRGLRKRGISPRGFGPIIPWVLETPERALRFAAELRARGIHVQAIRPPTVPPGSSRLRLTVTARHEIADLERALHAIDEVLQCEASSSL